MASSPDRQSIRIVPTTSPRPIDGQREGESWRPVSQEVRFAEPRVPATEFGVWSDGDRRYALYARKRADPNRQFFKK
jgi:hypothetical protein